MRPSAASTVVQVPSPTLREATVLADEPAPEPTMPDTDVDGIADTEDQCVDQPETYNGFMDSDGCPDRITAGNCCAGSN